MTAGAAAGSCCSATPAIRCVPTWRPAAPWRSRTRAILSRCLAEFDEPAEAYRWYEATRIRPRRRRAAHLDREQLDARPDRHRLVLLLRSLRGAADPAGLRRRKRDHDGAEARSDDRPRSGRIWRISAESRLARRRADRGQLQSQRRRRRRSLAGQWRRRVGGHAQRHRRSTRRRPARAAGRSRSSNMAAAAASGACSISSATFPSP